MTSGQGPSAHSRWGGLVAGCVGAVAAAAALAVLDHGDASVIEVPRHRIDLGTASASELALLPGVGPALAARIAADRVRNGSPASLDELVRVAGIGPATLESLRGEVCLHR